MLDEFFILLARPERYRCAWRNGELYLEPDVMGREAPALGRDKQKSTGECAENRRSAP